MRTRKVVPWMAVVACLGVGLLVGRSAWGAAPTLGGGGGGGGTQAQLEATVSALVAENAQQATEIARGSEFTSYLATRMPGTDPASTVDGLRYQNAALSTQVAELHTALGSPIPTLPPSPTFDPSPAPSLTPYLTPVPAVTPTP